MGVKKKRGKSAKRAPKRPQPGPARGSKLTRKQRITRAELKAREARNAKARATREKKKRAEARKVREQERKRVERNAKKRAAYAREKKVKSARKKAREDNRLKGEDMRRKLRPLLARMVQEVNLAQGVKQGLASKKTHASYYRAKMRFYRMMGESQYESILQALSDDLDLEKLGWDIVY